MSPKVSAVMENSTNEHDFRMNFVENKMTGSPDGSGAYASALAT